MNEVFDFFSKLLDTTDWPPRWHCGKWTGFHGWLYIVSDLLIWSAYFAIPLIILRFVSRKSNARFVRAYFLFAAFILACGSTHLLDAVTFWFPAYRLNALVRLVTGVVSWTTVFYMIRILPEAMTLKTTEELEREVAERKRAEQQLLYANRQLEESQQMAKLGYWEWDVPSGRLGWSTNLFRISGLEPRGENLTMEEMLSTAVAEDRGRLKAAVDEALDTGVYPSFYYHVQVDGQLRTLAAGGEVHRGEDGRVAKVLGTVQDVTEQREAQQALEEKTAQLEASNNELQRFAYVASHDLKEPLRKILTFASLLQQETSGHLNEKEKTYIGKIVQSTTRMHNLIEDILQLTDVREGGKSFRRVSLAEVLQQVLADMEVQIAQSAAQISWDGLAEIDAIPSQMGQLFQNLLGNAMKFAKPGQHPKIQVLGRELASDTPELTALFLGHGPVAAQSSDHRMLLITIRDEGIGFDSAYAGKVFEIFQRLHTGPGYAGTGIGLAICKRIVENHHGQIAVESAVDKGTTFSVLLPMVQQNGQSPS